MFRRAANHIENGDGNTQVSGNVGSLFVGISPEDHFKRIDATILEQERKREEIQGLLERAHEAEMEALRGLLRTAEGELDRLRAVAHDPELYFSMLDIPLTALLPKLSGQVAEGFSENLANVFEYLQAGEFDNATVKIEQIEEEYEVTSEMEAELSSAKATLALIEMRFTDAENAAKRSLYLDPKLDRLVRFIELLKLGNRRLEIKEEFEQGVQQINPKVATDEWLLIVGSRVTIESEFGDVKVARELLNDLVKIVETRDSVSARVRTSVIIAHVAVTSLEENWDEAIAHAKAAVEALSEEGEESRQETLRMQGNLAAVLAEKGDLDEAISLTEECVAGFREMGVLSTFHYGVRLNNLGDFLTRAGRPEEAIPVLRESIRIADSFLPNSHPSTIKRRSNLAISLSQTGSIDLAISTLKSIDTSGQRLNKNDKKSLVKSMMFLADLSIEVGNRFDALNALQSVERVGKEYVADPEFRDALPQAIENLQQDLLSMSVPKLVGGKNCLSRS